MSKSFLQKNLPCFLLALFELFAAGFLLKICTNLCSAVAGDPLFGWALISPLAILPFALCVLAWRFPSEKKTFRKIYIFAKISQIAGGIAYLSARLWYAKPQKNDFLEMAFVALNFIPAAVVHFKEIQSADNSDC